MWRRFICPAGVVVAMLANPAPIKAQDASQRPPAARAQGGFGVDLFGGAGIGWPTAKDSFDALDLNYPLEYGGGVRLTGLWRKLFAQVSGARWSDTGERAFIASDGTSFPLGIPLEVEATYVDATLGWKDAVRTASGRVSFLSYLGIGAGVVRYRESSPFAEPGDDLDTTEPSYHALIGFEVPIAGWLAAAVDGRYRYIPGLLGDAGVSGVLEEDSLGGFQLSAGFRVGFGGPRYAAPPPAPTVPPEDIPTKRPPAAVPEPAADGVIVEAAPVFLLPDATRTPLRILQPGTSVRILEETTDWVRVEFQDVQFGRRVGYVQRKFVQTRKTP